MSDTLLLVAAAVVCYLIGGIPFGYLIARWKGVDILKAGSGNIGATNVGRVLGRAWGLIVFVLDFAKGALPVAAATIWQEGSALWVTLPVVAGLAAFLGHLFPVYLRFRGGKGVATGAGVMAVLAPGPAAIALLAWFGVVFSTRTVSLASAAAAIVLVAARIVRGSDPFGADNRVVTLLCMLAALFVLVRHRANFGRIFRGTESRLPESDFMRSFQKTVHVLALGLWFGAAVFFTLSAALIFSTFDSLRYVDATGRAWLPLPAELTKEHTNALAGVAVNPLFDWFFPLQGVCGLLALATALAWTGLGPRVHRVRAATLFLGLVGVLVGWPLARYVGELRMDRYALDPAISGPAREAFGTWHGYSLLLQFATILLVTVAMALVAQLPEKDSSEKKAV